MADKNVSSLPRATNLGRDSLLVVEQQGEAKSLDLGLLQDFAKQGVDQYVTDAKTASEEALKAAGEATEAVGKIGTAVEDTQTAKTDAENAAQRAEDALANMGTAAEDAEKSAQAAAQSEANAKASEESVAANKTAAENAQKAAETARDESAAASTATGQNAATAATAAQNAGNSAIAAGNAAVNAEAARQAIENMMVEAITVATGNPATVSKEMVDGVVKLVFGLPQGKQGDKGDPGSSIQSIDRTAGNGAPGTTDTYTITLTTGETFNFCVYNGADGIGSGDMSKSVYDPQGKATDVFAYVDNAVKDVKVTTDEIPIPESTNPVQSGGVAAALEKKQDKLSGTQGQFVGFDAEGNPTATDLTIDVTPTEGSDNPVQSGGVYNELLTLTQNTNTVAKGLRDKQPKDFIVTATIDRIGDDTAISATYEEIVAAMDAGKNVIIRAETDSEYGTQEMRCMCKNEGGFWFASIPGQGGAVCTFRVVEGGGVYGSIESYATQEMLAIIYDDVNTRFQKKLTGTSGQVVGFDEGGNAVAQEAPQTANPAKAYTITLLANGWTEGADGRYQQTVAAEGVTTDPAQVIQVDVSLTGEDTAADAEAQAAWGPDDGTGPSSNNIKQGNGTLTFYCTAVPTINIPVAVGVH